MEARCNRGRRNRGRLNRGRHNRGRLQLAAIVRHLPMKPRALEGKRFSAGQAKRNADHNRSDSLAGGHSEVFRRPPGSIFHALSTRGTSSRRSCDTASTVHCFFKVPARTHFPRSDALPGGGGGTEARLYEGVRSREYRSPTFFQKERHFRCCDCISRDVGRSTSRLLLLYLKAM
jgi:hypothetical protein